MTATGMPRMTATALSRVLCHFSKTIEKALGHGGERISPLKRRVVYFASH